MSTEKDKKSRNQPIYMDWRERNCERTASKGNMYVWKTAVRIMGKSEIAIPCATVDSHSRLYGCGVLLRHGDLAWQNGIGYAIECGTRDGAFAPGIRCSDGRGADRFSQR